MILGFVKNLFSNEKIKHPFNVRKGVGLTFDNVEEVDGLEDVKWGNGIKKARIEKNDISISWEVDKVKKGDRLRAMNLDEFDMSIIRGCQVKPNAYKLVKPYVEAGWKYSEIGIVLGYSTRWVQDVAPKVKQAMKAREGRG